MAESSYVLCAASALIAMMLDKVVGGRCWWAKQKTGKLTPQEATAAETAAGSSVGGTAAPAIVDGGGGSCFPSTTGQLEAGGLDSWKV
jgi:hypothetical protein